MALSSAPPIHRKTELYAVKLDHGTNDMDNKANDIGLFYKRLQSKQEWSTAKHLQVHVYMHTGKYDLSYISNSGLNFLTAVTSLHAFLFVFNTIVIYIICIPTHKDNLTHKI